MSYVPQYSSYNATTGKFGNEVPAVPPVYSPLTAIPGASTNASITTESSVKKQFNDLIGRDPTTAELATLGPQINNRLSPLQVETAIKAMPVFSAVSADDNTAADVIPIFKNILNREPTKDEIAAYTRKTVPAVMGIIPAVPAVAAIPAVAAKAAVAAQPAIPAKAASGGKPATPAIPAVAAQPAVAAVAGVPGRAEIPAHYGVVTPEKTGSRESIGTISNALRATPEGTSAILSDLNAAGRAAFTHNQAPVASPTAIASTYQDVFNRPPTAAELAASAGLNPTEIKNNLTNSAEFKNNLTKSFVPALTYDNKGVASIQGAQPQEAQSTGLAALNTAINTQVGNKLSAPSNFNFAAPPSVQPTSPLVPPAASAVAKSDPVAAQLAALQMQKDLTARAEAQGLGSFVPQSANLTSPYSAGSPQFAQGGLSSINGRYNLGGYSDGGRLLRGPGDGVSDSIPAQIGNRQPARLADGEFVIPARIVSELGNGSTDAGARRLYAMMDRIQKARRKTIGKRKIAVNSRADKYLPA